MTDSHRFSAVLFDLDGTLLDHDMLGEFVHRYFEALTARVAHLVPPPLLVKAIWQATDAIVANEDGQRTNAEVFAAHFYPLVGQPPAVLEPLFDAFYAEDFPALRQYTRQRPEARRVVQTAFDLGYQVVVATNPLFPATAIYQRLTWAGVADFPYRKVTTYENSHAAKPNLRYYQELLDELGLPAEEVLMVGDEAMDLVAAQLEIATYLVPGPATKLEPTTPPPTYQGSFAAVETVLRSSAKKAN